MKSSRVLLAIFALVLVRSAFRIDLRGKNLIAALGPMIVSLLLFGFLIWREWKVARDPEFAEYHATRGNVPVQPQLAAMTFFWGFVVLLIVLLEANNLFPSLLNGIDPAKGGFVVMYVGLFGTIAVGIWSAFRQR